MNDEPGCKSRMQFLPHFFIDRDDDIFSFVHSFCKPMIFKLRLLFCLPFPNGLSYRIQIALIFEIFLMEINLLFWKKYLASQEAEISMVKVTQFFFLFLIYNFLLILKMTIFLLLLAISKRFEIQWPDWTHFVDLLK